MSDISRSSVAANEIDSQDFENVTPDEISEGNVTPDDNCDENVNSNANVDGNDDLDANNFDDDVINDLTTSTKIQNETNEENFEDENDHVTPFLDAINVPTTETVEFHPIAVENSLLPRSLIPIKE
ncbi:hypothetical protein DAMA08_052540 [Martiniozyma asiatica (nom. inval.)]|nr:hypothetical protein DAMA08_052540 [Martiniozyma asiatica]